MLPAHFQEIENAMLQPNAPIANTLANVNSNYRVAAGMPYYLANDCKPDNGGNAFALANLQADLDRLSENGVDPAKTLLLAGSGVVAAINQNKEVIVREKMNIRELDYNLNRIVLPNGTISIAPYTLALKPDEYYLFERDSIKVKFLRALKREALAKSGDSEKYMVVTEPTFEFHNWKAGAAIRRSNIGV
jgi:hypothetical protein